MLVSQHATILLDNADLALNRLQEALTRKTIARTLKPLETKLETSLAALFRKQSKALILKLPKIRSHLIESLSSDFNDMFDDATLDTSVEMQTAIDKSVKSSLLIGGKQLIAQFKADTVFNLTNPRAVLYTSKRAANTITNIDEETRRIVKALIVSAVENGTSYQELARTLKNRYEQFAIGVPQQHIRSRAELIAITEVGNAYQAGNYAAAFTIEENGVALEKSWFNSGDDRVSAGCLANTAAGWIAIDTAFPSGDQTPLRFPGCRCVLQYRRAVKSTTAPKAIDVPEETSSAIPASYAFKYNSETGQAVADALGDLFPDTTLNWSGKIIEKDMAALGTYQMYTGDIALSTRYVQDQTLPDGRVYAAVARDELFKAFVHEFLHARSKGIKEYGPQVLGWEEGIVEGNARRIVAQVAKKVGYTPETVIKNWQEDYSQTHPYTRFVNRFTQIAFETKTDPDVFFEKMLNMTSKDRKTYVETLFKAKYKASGYDLKLRREMLKDKMDRIQADLEP